MGTVLGQIPNTIEDIRKVIRRLGNPSELMVCYEAGPTGYGLARILIAMGVGCMVVAPSLIPRQPGDRVKTDRRDKERLAELLRAGELKQVWIPTQADEALRDLVRTREDRKQDLVRIKDRITKFLLRHRVSELKGTKRFEDKHNAWLSSLKFHLPALNSAFSECVLALTEIRQSIRRLNGQILALSRDSFHAPVIRALQALRGVKEITAATLVAEVGEFSRFSSPTQLMAYAGLVPKEYSSGQSRTSSHGQSPWDSSRKPRLVGCYLCPIRFRPDFIDETIGAKSVAHPG